MASGRKNGNEKEVRFNLNDKNAALAAIVGIAEEPLRKLGGRFAESDFAKGLLDDLSAVIGSRTSGAIFQSAADAKGVIERLLGKDPSPANEALDAFLTGISSKMAMRGHLTPQDLESASTALNRSVESIVSRREFIDALAAYRATSLDCAARAKILDEVRRGLSEEDEKKFELYYKDLNTPERVGEIIAGLPLVGASGKDLFKALALLGRRKPSEIATEVFEIKAEIAKGLARLRSSGAKWLHDIFEHPETITRDFREHSQQASQAELAALVRERAAFDALAQRSPDRTYWGLRTGTVVLICLVLVIGTALFWR